MEGNIVKIKCDFCGKEIECPEDMMKAEKHACFECFQSMEPDISDKEVDKIHVDIPRDKMEDMMSRDFAQQLLESVFPDLWREAREDVKQMSRKESSERMFVAGAQAMFDFMLEMEKRAGEKEKENKATE